MERPRIFSMSISSIYPLYKLVDELAKGKAMTKILRE